MANEQVTALEKRVEALENEVNQLWKWLLLGKIEQANDRLVAVTGLLGDVPAEPGPALGEPVRLEHPERPLDAVAPGAVLVGDEPDVEARARGQLATLDSGFELGIYPHVGARVSHD